MKKITLLFVIIILGLNSCKTEKKAPEKTQMQSVMEVHDAVMPKMGSIGRLVKELNTRKDSLLALESPSQQTIETLNQGLDSLKGAHKKMMDWMKGFGSQFTPEEILKGKTLTPEKKILLKQESIKVRDMEASVNGSISNAEYLLGLK